ncbi:MAG: glycosyltransferase family 4 protein [Gammaproteobacteria bacterium]|nr:glycosyltransferase family 4 protein [Gammaproteobacteria bacterium]
MKVVQVLPAMESGGVEQGTLEIAEALTAAGHESIVVSKGGRLVDRLERAGSRHRTWDIGRKHPATVLAARRFRRWLADERPAILHARSRLPAWVCWLAWRAMPENARPRFVTTVHGLYSVSRYSAIMVRGERVIAVSDTARRYVQANYPRIDMAKVDRIYRGVDRQRFHRGLLPGADWLATWRRDFPASEGRDLVVLPGRLTRLKGHTDFIDVMEQLHNTHPNALGVVVGGVDPRHRAYADEIRRRGRDIVFTGQRSDLPEIMAIAEAVVSLSQKPESFGRTVLEALSLGTPVVGYEHGGVGEILTHVYAAGRVPVGDTGAVARRLGGILDDPATATRAILDHDFDVARMCAQTIDLYGELVRGKSNEAATGRCRS